MKPASVFATISKLITGYKHQDKNVNQKSPASANLDHTTKDELTAIDRATIAAHLLNGDYTGNQEAEKVSNIPAEYHPAANEIVLSKDEKYNILLECVSDIKEAATLCTRFNRKEERLYMDMLVTKAEAIKLN